MENLLEARCRSATSQKAALFTRIVDSAERIDGFPGYGLADSRLANVARKEHGLATGFGNKTFGLAGVGLLERLSEQTDR